MQHLQLLLSDLIVLSQKARSYHWNVTGPLFYAWHDVYGKLYDELSDRADTVAERIRSLEWTPVLTLSEALSQTAVHENTTLGSAESLRDDMISDISGLTLRLSESMTTETDEVTKDLLIQIAGDLEKTLWMLRSTRI